MNIKRWDGNPILRPLSGSYWEGEQVRNPAAIYHEGKVHLIYTASGDIRHEHLIYLGHAVSDDGFHFERTQKSPLVSPTMDEFSGFDAGGVEDPRIVKIEDTFYITYMARAVGFHAFRRGVRREDAPSDAPAWSKNYRRGGLLASKDLRTFKRLGPITSDQHFDANVILFPEKIDGKFMMLHRPSEDYPEGYLGCEAGISIAYSDNLIDWYDDKPLIGPMFEWEDKIGGSTPPIRTEAGWLTLYHAAEFASPDKPWYFDTFLHSYRVGVMLLDFEDPSKVIARSADCIMEPIEDYEKWGTVNNVVFPTGTVIMNEKLFIYYGGADTVCGVATVGLDELIEHVLKYPCGCVAR